MFTVSVRSNDLRSSATPQHTRRPNMQHSRTDLGPALYGARGEFSLSGRAWRLLLALASTYGWKPAGTQPPDPESVDDKLSRMAALWDGRYTPSDCQRMTERDTRAMADALERALPDIPDHDALSEKVLASRADDPLALWGRPAAPEVTITAMEEFSGRNKRQLMSLIAHLREPGGIWIC
jgi:hypothetical protein